MHKRSVEVTEISGKVVWGDEYGHKFTSKGFKGYPQENEIPYVEIWDHQTNDLRVHYMCELDDIQTADKVSKYLRENGLATERITRVHKLENITLGNITIRTMNMCKN